MACFLVPAAEAAVVSVVTKVIRSKEENLRSAALSDTHAAETKLPFYRKLKWLSNLLWGGSLLLAFEHAWHGEVTPWFPFLSAAADPADTAVMLHEMATVGVSMAVIVTVVWGLMLLACKAIEKRPAKAQVAGKQG